MSCEKLRRSIADAAIGGECDPVLSAHLRECALCRRELETGRALMQAIDQELRSELSVAPSPDLVDKVRLSIQQAGKAPGMWQLLRWPAAGLVLASLVLLLVWVGTVRIPPAEQIAHPTNAPVEHEILPPPKQVAGGSIKQEAAEATRTALSRPAKRRLSARPEVLVRPDGMESIKRLYHALWNEEAEIRTQTAASLLARGSKTLLEIKDIEISPLEIEDLPLGTSKPVAGDVPGNGEPHT